MTTKLTIPTEGPCAGHKCDNCKICRSGRCCRRDNPDYKLPELGEWNGPIYGELGVLVDDGQKVECHCCGEWFTKLGHHIIIHDLTAEEYKSVFGLNKHRGLAAPDVIRQLSDRQKQNKVRCEALSKMARQFIATKTPEQRHADGKAPKRLQWRRNVGHHAHSNLNPNSKLTRDQVIEIYGIRPRPDTYLEYESLANKFGVHVESIRNVLHGRTWASLSTELGIDVSERGKPGPRDRRPQTKPKRDAILTVDQVREIRRLDPRSMKEYRDLAERFGVKMVTVRHVVYRLSWKWLDQEQVAA